MGKIYRKGLSKKTNEALDEIIKGIDLVLQTEDDPNTQLTKILSLLMEMASANDKNGEAASDGDVWIIDKTRLPEVIAKENGLVIRPFTPEDQERYMHVIRMWDRSGFIRNMENISGDILWERTQKDHALYAAIERESDRTFLGYIALKDTRKLIWELAIELDKEYCGQGYGSRAIALFLRWVEEQTLRSEYMALVEVDNLACQACMERVGAELFGIRNLLFDTPEEAEQFENEHMDMITDQLITLAARLGVEPRKLLSHVLEYRLFA